MARMDIIKEIVSSNLNDALENGHFEPDGHLHGYEADDIVTDMRAYASDCEEIAAEVLKPHVEQWMKDHAAQI